MIKRNFRFTFFATCLLLSACGEGFEKYPVQVVRKHRIEQLPPTDTQDPDGPEEPPAPPELKFCSPLDFKGITWSQDLSLVERRSLAISLSISGSFEGSSGWINLANNFDGQGMSAGLLNQTLGTGSLQPLLAEMDFKFPQEFAASFSSAHLTSIRAMLEEWKKNRSWHPNDVEKSLSIASELKMQAMSISEGDISVKMSAPEKLTVDWAKKNLYTSSGSFIASWKSEIQNLLNKPNYISLQVHAANHYHAKAISYLPRIRSESLVAYLTMFDLVVQNGGVPDSRFKTWDAQVAAKQITDPIQKLKALVDIRILDALPKWQPDVKSRKYTIIDGKGTVHGKKYDLPKMFCYEQNDPVK